MRESSPVDGAALLACAVVAGARRIGAIRAAARARGLLVNHASRIGGYQARGARQGRRYIHGA